MLGLGQEKSHEGGQVSLVDNNETSSGGAEPEEILLVEWLITLRVSSSTEQSQGLQHRMTNIRNCKNKKSHAAI